MKTSYRILLIEDNRADARLFQRYLEKASSNHYQIEHVENYEDGLEMLLNEEHDICFLDYKLCNRNGLDLLTNARSNGCMTPIIFLTGMQSPALEDEVFKAGANYHLHKGDLNRKLLERTIVYITHHAHHTRQLLQARLNVTPTKVAPTTSNPEQKPTALHRFGTKDS